MWLCKLSRAEGFGPLTPRRSSFVWIPVPTYINCAILSKSLTCKALGFLIWKMRITEVMPHRMVIRLKLDNKQAVPLKECPAYCIHKNL